MKRYFRLFAVVLLAAPLVAIAKPVKVTNGADAGPGSLRAALESGAKIISISPSVDVIAIETPLVFEGDDSLTIRGTGQTIDGFALADGDSILDITMGADLDISNLAFQGQGGFDIQNKGGGVGINLEVPLSRTGVVSVVLKRVGVYDVGNHGVLINDCTLDPSSPLPSCGGGTGGADDLGSDASIDIQLVDVVIDGVGFGNQDGDGLRANERGPGSITFSATNSEFNNVGGDGVELDENQEGDVVINGRNLAFDNNGAYCAADDGFGGTLPVATVLALDPNCNDDDEPDVDDAWDIDEGGPGGIFGIADNLLLTRNLDEGIDFDVDGEGNADGLSADLHFVNIVAMDNLGDGIKLTNDGADDIRVRLNRVKTNNEIQIEDEEDNAELTNGDVTVFISALSMTGDDVKIDEFGDGDLKVEIRGSNSDDDVELEEDGAGDLDLTIRGSTIDTVEAEENDAGTKTVTIKGSSIANPQY